MNKWLKIVVCVLVSVTSAQAGGLFFGAHGGYTLGGDVEDESFGYGAQLGVDISENLIIELAGTVIEDDTPGSVADFDLGSLALTVALGSEVSEDVSLYIGGGVNYNRFSFDSNASFEVEDDDKVGFHVCAGIGAMLSDWLRLFGEYRYTFLEYDVERDGAFNPNLSGSSQDYSFGMIRVGASIVL